MTTFPPFIAKRGAFRLCAGSYLYVLDAMLPGSRELPDEQASFHGPFDITCCVNEELAQTESTKLDTDAEGRHRSC